MMSEHCSDPACTHSHHPIPTNVGQQRLLLLALVLILSFAVVEWMVGWLSHSLALMADSGHMASDGLAIALAGLAVWLSRRQPHSNSRWESWAALINGMALTAIAGWILWEAITRLQNPVAQIASIPMLITAGIGAVVNGINVRLLHSHSHASLNLRAAFLHVLADTISSVGVILAAIAIAVFHWVWVDGVVSLLVALFILYHSMAIVKQTIQALKLKSVELPTQS